MTKIRQALIGHIETLKAFVSETMGVDSGIYDVEQMGSIMEQPDTIVRMETDWISALLEAFQLLHRYNQLVDSWATHVNGLSQNLGATVEEIPQIEQGQISAVEIFETKTITEDYLRWVLEDISQELDRLVAASHELLSEIPRLLQLLDQFAGTYFGKVKSIVLDWVNTSRDEFITPLFEILQSIHSLTDTEEILQHLGRYVDVLVKLATSAPMFVIESTIMHYTPQTLSSSHGYVSKLIEGTENLRKFVQLRVQAYLLLLRHYEALLRAVLPAHVSVQEWIITYRVDESQTANDLLPAIISMETLPLALQQAEEALTEWDASVKHAIPFLQKALILNTLLQSPSVGKFLTADQRRLELYHNWRPRIGTSFIKLRTAVEKQTQSTPK